MELINFHWARNVAGQIIPLISSAQKNTVGGRINLPDTVPVLGKRRAQTKCGSVGPGAAGVLIGCLAVHRLYGLCLLLELPSGIDGID